MPRYAVTLLIALFAALAGFSGFNALIDPFNITGSPDIPGLTSRDTRIYDDGGRVHVGDELARGGVRAILLGSSRTVAYGQWILITLASLFVMGLSEPLLEGPWLGFMVIMWSVTTCAAPRRARTTGRGALRAS